MPSCWAEAYMPDVGWALGDGQEHGDDPASEADDSEALYNLLEHEVVPQFYTRDQRGIPGAWVARMRESMAHLTPRFSSNRAVREYTEQYYLPATSAYLERAADKGKMGVDVLDWRHALDQRWSALHFSDAQFKTNDGQRVFEVQLYLGCLHPNAVRVELYADGAATDIPERLEMKLVRSVAGAVGSYIYRAAISVTRPPADYTPRVIPYRAGIAVPLEDARILWQR